MPNDYKNVNGIRVQLTDAEQTKRNSDIAAWNNGAFDRAMKELRAERNSLLAETDYLALSDHTLSADMSAYRQELRDITNGLTTVEDVNTVTWPTKP
tara:strand:+ start:600 stop:890 length:291 start_codon:yes stop_codon:yes gene_type:complete